MSHLIDLATAISDIQRCFAVMVQLRPHLDPNDFVRRVQHQQAGGYQLVYLQQAETVRAIAGFRLMDTLAHGKLLYVDDLVTDRAERSQGYGAALLDWLAIYAQTQGCASLQLDSGVQRPDAHRFYFRQRMAITSFRFSRPLTPVN